MRPPGSAPKRHSVFQAGPVEYDETRLELHVAGRRQAIETKPLALLHTLLVHAGEVVTKRELIRAAWGNADHIAETSLTTAMSKLRQALGEDGRDIVEVVHGVGYRINVPVEVRAVPDPTQLAFAFRAGDAVPGRPQWRLEALLGPAPLNDTWLARHEKTGEPRVFKFADSERRLDTLKREATLSRVLHAALGDRDDLVRIVEWNVDRRPFFIESFYGGPDLLAWTAAQGGLAAVGLDLRMAMMAQIARTVAAAHGAGVLHGDLKPANILVGDTAPLRLRVLDFGAGGLAETAQRAGLAISLDALEEASGDSLGGTIGYIAPEILAGGAPTTGADVYALGILLYQMAAGHFGKSLSVGWEADIGDELLRDDIGAAAAGDPARRLPSAASLAERVSALPARRAALRQSRRDAERADALARQVETGRLRRPWIAAAAVSLTVGLTLATGFDLRAVHDRDAARRRAELAQAVNAFLTEDLLGRGDPARSGRPDETLMQAARAAEGFIGRRLAAEPLEAGAIYLSLARTYESRSAYGDARRAYDAAASSFQEAGSQGAADRVIARLREAGMETASGQPGSLPRASALVADAGPRVGGLGSRRPEADIWQLRAQGRLDVIRGEELAARAKFMRAADAADAMPQMFDETTRLALRNDLVSTYIRTASWPQA